MKLFIDFDNTIVNTTKAFVDYYNTTFDFDNKQLKEEEIIYYNFERFVDKDLCLDIKKVFERPKFYDQLKVYPGVLWALNELNKSGLFEIILVSNCTVRSMQLKLQWLTNMDMLRFFDKFILLDNGMSHGKSLINMEGGILIDDHKLNHITSNAKYHFAYKHNPRAEWYPMTACFNIWGEEIVTKLKEISLRE